MKQDRMSIVPTHRPHPLLAAVEPITAPAGQISIDHADDADTQALAVEIAWFQRALGAPGLLTRAFLAFREKTALHGHVDGGTLTYTDPAGDSVRIAISPTTARKVAKTLRRAAEDADAHAGLGVPASGHPAPRRRRLALAAAAPAPVQS